MLMDVSLCEIFFFHFFKVKVQVYTKSMSRNFSIGFASLGWQVQSLDFHQVGVIQASLSRVRSTEAQLWRCYATAAYSSASRVLLHQPLFIQTQNSSFSFLLSTYVVSWAAGPLQAVAEVRCSLEYFTSAGNFQLEFGSFCKAKIEEKQFSESKPVSVFACQQSHRNCSLTLSCF